MSINSVSTYLDWILDALYASHPNIIKPTMWFKFSVWQRHALPVDVSPPSASPWGKITFFVVTEMENTHAQNVNKLVLWVILRCYSITFFSFSSVAWIKILPLNFKLFQRGRKKNLAFLNFCCVPLSFPDKWTRPELCVCGKVFSLEK